MSTQTTAMLVHLSFHAGTQSGQDEETTAEICSAKHATEEGITANVRYICREAYKPITSLKGEFVKKVKRITTSTDIQSVRLARASAVPKVIALKDEYFPAFELIKQFHLINKLPEWKDLTQLQTGAAWKPERFPTEDQLRQACRWELSILPLPESELLRKVKELDATLIDTLVASQEARNQQMFARAKAEVYARMLAPVQHMVDTLAEDKPKIFETLVTNLADIVEAIGDLNHDNDPMLHRFAEQAGAMLKGIDLKALKNDPVIRKATAAQAQQMLEQFGKVGSRKFAPTPADAAA